MGRTARLAIATVVWIGTLALARFGPTVFWDGDAALSWIAIVVNLAAGIVWIVVHARYLRGEDELGRKILMDAIAAALGVGLVGGFALAAAEHGGLVSVEADIALLAVVMSIAYLIGIVVGKLRYR